MALLGFLPTTSVELQQTETFKRRSAERATARWWFKYKKEENQVSDHDLAAKSKNIDLIIGGHTHTLLKQPEVVKNLDNKEVLITQAGWGGILLGRLDFVFLPKDQVKCLACNFNLMDSQLEN